MYIEQSGIGDCIGSPVEGDHRQRMTWGMGRAPCDGLSGAKKVWELDQVSLWRVNMKQEGLEDWVQSQVGVWGDEQNRLVRQGMGSCSVTMGLGGLEEWIGSPLIVTMEHGMLGECEWLCEWSLWAKRSWETG